MQTDQWYFVEVSWSAGGALEVHVDLKKVADGHETKKTVDETSLTDSRLCICCFNAPKNTSTRFQRTAANVIIDELLICYGSCAKLTEFEFLQRGTVGAYACRSSPILSK